MDMQAATGLAHSDFRGECHIQSIFVGQLTDNPFGQNQLIGGLFHISHQKFYLILLINLVTQSEIAHFGMAVLDGASGLGYIVHGTGAELPELAVWTRLVVTFLVGGLEQLILVPHHIILQFAHRLELHACHLLKRFFRLFEDILRR